jgi:four helix bundle protein
LDNWTIPASQIPKSEILYWTRNLACNPTHMVADVRKAEETHRRLIELGARATRVAKMLPRTDDGRYLSQQLLRCGMAGAANYAEARAAESRKDFIHKLRIVLKELNETQSWLKQIVANGHFSRDKMAANYRGKPSTLPDHRLVHQNGKGRLQSNLRFRISGSEMQESSNCPTVQFQNFSAVGKTFMNTRSIHSAGSSLTELRSLSCHQSDMGARSCLQYRCSVIRYEFFA